MTQFYAPDILTDPVLPEGESRHCAGVLRMVAGEQAEAVDGLGHRCHITILEPHRSHTLVRVDSVEEVERPWPMELTVAVGPTKHMDRMEWLVEKLTEIGVDRIIPVLCRHSERRELKQERLVKIAVSAMKQSLKATLPVIDPLTPVAQVIAGFGHAQRFIAHCSEAYPALHLACTCRPAEPCVILIGPEGDFDSAEISSAIAAGWTPTSLGPSRLRTETAALYAAMTAHTISAAASCPGA